LHKNTAINNFFIRVPIMNKHTPKIVAHLLPTFGNILWMAAFFRVLLWGRQIINVDGDLALHLNLGKYILNTRRIPLQDVFSHTMSGEAVTQHEWLSAVIFEGIMRPFGLDGVIFLCALVISITVLMLYKFLRRKSQTLLPVLFVVTITIINSILHWLPRPHIFSYPLLTLWLIILDRLRKGEFRSWWILPALMMIWVNLHGGFIIGFIVWIIFGFGTAWDSRFQRIDKKDELPKGFWRVYLSAGLTSFLASLLNPSGIGLWKTVIGHVGNKYLAGITEEFQSPNFHNMTFLPLLLTIGLLIIVLGFSEKKIKSEQIFNTTAWLIMSLYSARNIPLFAIAMAPLLVSSLDSMLENANLNFKIFPWLKGFNSRMEILDSQLKGNIWPFLCAIAVILGLGMGFRFDINRQGYEFDPKVFPVQAVEWIKDNPQQGEMFNFFQWGGYLQYHLWPENLVFIDSKSDFYGEDFLRQYGQVIAQQDGWEYVLKQNNVDWAILPIDEPAADAIQRELGWKAIYEDETAVVLIRQ